MAQVWIYAKLLAGTSPRDFSFDCIPAGQYTAVVPGSIFDLVSGAAINSYCRVAIDDSLGIAGTAFADLPAMDQALFAMLDQFQAQNSDPNLTEPVLFQPSYFSGLTALTADQHQMLLRYAASLGWVTNE